MDEELILSFRFSQFLDHIVLPSIIVVNIPFPFLRLFVFRFLRPSFLLPRKVLSVLLPPGLAERVVTRLKQVSRAKLGKEILV